MPQPFRLKSDLNTEMSHTNHIQSRCFFKAHSNIIRAFKIQLKYHKIYKDYGNKVRYIQAINSVNLYHTQYNQETQKIRQNP